MSQTITDLDAKSTSGSKGLRSVMQSRPNAAGPSLNETSTVVSPTATLEFGPLTNPGVSTTPALSENQTITTLASFSDGGFSGRIEGSEPQTRLRPIQWRPSRHTQAFLAHKREPYLRRLGDYLSELSRAESQQERRKLNVLCKEQIDLSWQFVDERDDHVAQYLSLLNDGVKDVYKSFSRAKVRVLLNVLDSVLEQRLNADARHEARATLRRAGMLSIPELTEDQSIALDEVAKERIADDEA